MKTIAAALILASASAHAAPQPPGPYYLATLLWNIPNVEEDKAQLRDTKSFDSYAECMAAREAVVASIHNTNGGIIVICLPGKTIR